MAKPVGPLCNLDCRYCFYLEKERLFPDQAGGSPSQWAMGDQVLEAYIRQYIDSQPTPVVSFTWQGGEPSLLGLEYFRKVVDLQRRFARGRTIENAFQTNGLLLDDAWCAFFAEQSFLVGLSLDGPRHLHDLHRVDRGGLPTFTRVMAALRLLKKHGVEFNTLSAVHRHNASHPLEVYRFLKAEGSGFMQFIPVVERVAGEARALVPPGPCPDAVVSEWSVGSRQYGDFLCAIFDEWVRQDVGRHYVQAFDAALANWMGLPPGLCVFQATCGAALALEHNGDVYACDHFVYEAFRLGNLLQQPLVDLANNQAQRAFGAAKAETLPQFCRACEVRFACHGECPKHRFLRTADGEPGLNYLCEGYQRFFRHIDPYMQFMAHELRQDRAPANVMAWARQRSRN